MSKSRTTNTIYNFATGIVGQFIAILMQFIVRTVFIQTLGKSYLGINGLFSNILSMLSLAELGVGSAILFKLYDPLAKNNKARISVLMKFYKTVYMWIGIIVTIIGVLLIPFLHYMINDYDKLETLGINAVIIYLLYLLQSVSSYLFFAYKSAIIRADQKEYKLNIVSYIFTIATTVSQIILLKIVSNFEIYITISVVFVILQNIVNAHIANKDYPYLKEKTEQKIEKKEIKEIFKDCFAIFLYKINGVVLKATDNIIISSVIGLEMVGMYSNYYILYTTIRTIFAKVFDSVIHSIGNLHAVDEAEHEYTVFKSVNFISVIIGATAGVGIFCISDNFVKTWIGDEWVLLQPFSLLMGIEIYILAITSFLSKYRSAMGLFQQAKYRPLASMLINLVVSFVLVKYWGVCGVLVGTIVSSVLTIMWYEPVIIHKYGLKNKFPVRNYFIKNAFFAIVLTGAGAINYIVSRYVYAGHGWISIGIHAVVCCVTVPLIFILAFIKTEEGKYTLGLAQTEIKKVIAKVKR
ncbi:MAG: oligosaccharide flippase family protein [Clostridia bacterium]|nr:oligosaccharide flippase family protein [Clostridia bacterium]